MNLNPSKIITRLTTTILALVGIIVVMLFVFGYFCSRKDGNNTSNPPRVDIVDYLTPPIEINDLKSYRRSANFLEHDFNPNSGKEIFNVSCAACHRLEDRTLIAPALRGLFDRVPNKEWLLSFMIEPDSTIELSMEYSTKLRTGDWPQLDKRFHRDSIFNSRFKERQIYDVLGYIGMKN